MKETELKINVRVSKELKQAMRQHKNGHCIDWSAKIRKFIEEEIKRSGGSL
jgi:hypothetical protein